MKRPLLFFMVLFVFALGNVARAATRTWLGTVDVNWSNGANWLGGFAPVAGDNVIIPILPLRQPTVDATSTCSTLTINGTTTLTLSNTLTVSNGLTINNNSAVLTIAGTGTATISGTTTFAFNSSLNISSTTATVNFSGVVDLTAGNSLCKITNSGSLNFTSVVYNAGFQTSITNTGTFTLTSVTFSTSNNNNVSITNSGTLNATSCVFSLTSQASSITNTNICNISSSTITLGTQNVSNITNTSPGIFTINNGSTINITGYRSYITNSGTFYAGTSNSACTINVSGKGNSLSPYSITNSGTFYLGSTSAINLTGTDSSNPTNLVNTGTFTFQSDANGSAILGQLGSGSSTVGNYNVQRYLTGGNVKYRSYRLLSSPVNSSGNIDLSYIGANATIGGTTYYGALTAGPSGGGFTVTNANPTLYLYDESRASNNSTFTSGKNIGVVAVAGTNVSTLTGTTVAAGKTIPVGNGFMFYFIGNNQSSSTASNRVPENTTITAIGTINQQDVPVKLWNTGTTGLYLTNNLVGNPYPSTIDLNQVYSDNYNLTTNPISPIFYELSNINPGQSYGIYNGALFTSSGNASRFIASGQGFFATVTANNQTITFKEDQKATTQLTGATLLMSTPENKLAVNSLIVPGSSDVIGSSFASQGNNAISGLHISMIQDTSVFDICGIYFMDGGIDKFDRNDGKDLDGISPKIYMSSYTTDGVRTGLNTMGSYIKGKKVKLYVKATTDGVYKLNLTDIQNIDITNYNLYLKDHYTKDSLDLSHNSSYSFRINNSDTTTFGANRFELVIAPKPLPPYALTSFTAKKVNEGVLLTWQTANEGNYTGFTLQKQNGNQFTALNNLQSNGAGTYTYIDHNPTTGTNAYRLMQSGLEANISYSETISVLYNTNSLNLYPNPAKDDINIYVNAPTTDNNPAYQMSIYDSSGTLILTKQINKAYTHNVATLRIGTYIVQVTDNNGKLIGNNKFSKIQ